MGARPRNTYFFVKPILASYQVLKLHLENQKKELAAAQAENTRESVHLGDFFANHSVRQSKGEIFMRHDARSWFREQDVTAHMSGNPEQQGHLPPQLIGLFQKGLRKSGVEERRG